MMNDEPLSTFINPSQSMLVTDDPALIGNGNGDFGFVVEYDALTTEPTFQPGIDCPIDKVFFLVRDFFQKRFALFYVNMAGRACAYTAAIMVEVHVVLFRQFKNRQVFKIPGDGFGRDRGIFK